MRRLCRVGPVRIDTRADYSDGDPAEPGPITDGTLALDADGLHFSHDGHELHAGLEVAERPPVPVLILFVP